MQLHPYVLKLIYLRSNIKEIYDHHTKHMQKIIMTPFKWNFCILLLKNDLANRFSLITEPGSWLLIKFCENGPSSKI